MNRLYSNSFDLLEDLSKALHEWSTVKVTRDGTEVIQNLWCLYPSVTSTIIEELDLHLRTCSKVLINN